MPKAVINNFSGGISDDVRDTSPSSFAISTHFDVRPKKLVPLRSMEADEDTSFVITAMESDGSVLYGMGEVSGTSQVKIFGKNDEITGAWTAETTAEGSTSFRADTVFTFYKDYLYGLHGTSHIWSYKPSTDTFNDTALATTYTSGQFCKGLVTSDDYFLQPYGNKIAVKDGGSSDTDNWNATGITVPSHLTIVDLVEIGDLIAVACRPNVFGHSYVYLWDKVSLDFFDRIDWGRGSLKILGEVDGMLIGVSEEQTEGTSVTHALESKVVFKRWAGGDKARTFKTIECDDTTLEVYSNNAKLIEDTGFLFGMKIKIDTVTYNGIWRVGRLSENYPLSVTHFLNPDNDSAITSVEGIFKQGGYYFVAHNGDGSINRINNDSAYSATSTYISQKMNGEAFLVGASTKNKVLEVAGLTMTPLPSGATASLYYRVDSTSAWTKIFDEATDNALAREAGVDNAGNDFFNFKEIQFKIESTGNATITGLFFEFVTLDSDIDE